MNRNCYRLVFNTTLGMMVPVAETAHCSGKSSSGKSSSGKAVSGKATSNAALALAGMMLAGSVHAELPLASANFAAPGTTAGYQESGTQAYLSQVGSKAVVNFDRFNISAGHDLRLQRVDNLVSGNLVQGAKFSVLANIHDLAPSIIAGSISQAQGQQASLTMVNTNGIAFLNGSQININSFTASSLRIADEFITGNLLNNETTMAQFGVSGEEGSGFIKVFEGAQISAGQFGRVMLIAPTVVNRGTVTAPNGQVIAAAGSRVFLRSAGDDTNVRGLLVEVDSPANVDALNPGVVDVEFDGKQLQLRNAAEDKIGHVTNAATGTLSTPRGNVTMIGYAVNQQGIARATTSVVENGSVYLLAKDEAIDRDTSLRGGRVTLAAGSLTEVLPEVADQTTSIDPRDKDGNLLLDLNGKPLLLEKRSQVRVLGQVIEMESGATIDAPSADVTFVAQDNPSEGESGTNSPFTTTGANRISDTARVHIGAGARINVAGLENVEVSVARNSVEIELRGNELKDSPANREGELRGEKVYVDINRALAHSDSGDSTLIARDALESNLANLQRTAAERSTSGGTVTVKSQGEALLDSGALIDLSGGSVQYTAANVKTTLLTANGKLIDIADADAETRYDGIATRFVKDYGRWNVKKVFDLGQSYRYDSGYREGKDAGQLNVVGMKSTQMDASVAGRTVTGSLQREAGTQPKGAGLKLGTDKISNVNEYKLNQKVVIGTKTADDINTLALNPALFGQGKIADLEVFSNQAAEVREALRLPQGGSVSITAKGVAANADVIVQAGRGKGVAVPADVIVQPGSVKLQARDNSVNTSVVPLDVTVAAGVTLSTAGGWANDLPTESGQSGQAALIDGGTISLSAIGKVVLEQASQLKVGGGGRVQADGTLLAGNGGDVTLDGNTVQLGGDVRGHALGKGGKFTVKTDRIQIGGVSDPEALNLDAGFFERGGFADINLTGVRSIDIADGTTLRPTVQSLDMQNNYLTQKEGNDIAGFSRIVVREDRLRQAANVSLTANSPADAAQGTIRLGENARILADDQAKISFSAKTRIDLQGAVKSAGGEVSANISRGETEAFEPSAAIWLGPQAVVDVSGAAQTYTDGRGLTQGKVLAGGSVSLGAKGGYVVTEAGSRIAVSGAAPVRLDVPNETGGLGRSVGSDAGVVTIATSEGALLDGAIDGRACSAQNRGGMFNFTLNAFLPTNERVLNLSTTVAPQAAGLTPGGEIPAGLNGNTVLGTAALEAAGFDRMGFVSNDAIRLENGLALGADRTLPLRELKIDTARVEISGSGDAALRADTIRFANSANTAAPEPVSGTGGTLTADARLIAFSDTTTFTGMNALEFKGAESVRFEGLGSNPQGRLKTAADVTFNSAVIGPATAVKFAIEAIGRTVSFGRNTNAPTQPWSAFGSLSVDAMNIVQDGNLWAPHGQLIFKATNNLEFRDGSLTSVAAAPGSLLPYGRIENGRAWVVGADGADVEIKDLSQKAIRTEGLTVDMQAGAKMNLAGGGDLQAYEFTVGPGGSRDILADKNTYAILPGYTGGFAPADVQENVDRASGEAVYLSGVPGLADGVYTLLPAHYALLPGAYAVKLDSGIANVMPGQAYSRQDGVRIAAGYVTDSRIGAPRDANWQGVQVMTRDQVRARSEFTLTRATEFFADGRMRPQDAGLLSVATTGSGADALKLDAVYDMKAGAGGRGAQVDISALKIAVTSGSPAGIDPDAVVLDADRLNALGADSLFIGGTRSTQGDTTTLTVGATEVMLANDSAHALKTGEIMLAAKDTLTLKAGSALDAQGAAGDAGAYETDGNGAFVRAASTTATFARSGSPDRSAGSLIGEAGSTIAAADSITLDATKENAFKGATRFEQEKTVNGVVQRTRVAGNLAVGATRINFGEAPGSAEGITFNQAELDAYNSLKGLTLTSYTTFDMYTGKTETVNGVVTASGVKIGGLDGDNKPTLQNLTLQGAGLAGIGNAGQTAQINAKNLTLANPADAKFSLPKDADGNEVALGSGNLAVIADTLTLGTGVKAIKGFGSVTVTANELVAATGTGSLAIDAPATLNVARISGEKASNQNLTAAGALTVAQRTADRTLAPVTVLGAKWAMQGSSIDFNSHAELPSGTFKLTATAGDVKLGANAQVDVAGRAVQFFDVTKPSWGGTAEFVSENGNVEFAGGSKVDVSAAAGGDAGTLIVRAAKGTVSLADGSVSGTSAADADGQRGEGARALIDSGTLASFSALNTALNRGGFDGARDLRVRTGDVSIAKTDVVKAQAIKISADGDSNVVGDGKINVAGTLDASGEKAGSIELFAKNNVNVESTARLAAVSSGANEDGGDIEIGTRDGQLNLAANGPGKGINVSGGKGGQGGTVLLRALRIGSDTDVAVNALDSSISGARSVTIEAVKVYAHTGDKTLTSSDLDTIIVDNNTFAGKHAAIKTRLNKTETDPTKPGFVHIVSGVEVNASGDLTLADDWNLSTARAGGEVGVLTLRAEGNLNLDASLSDGFNVVSASYDHDNDGYGRDATAPTPADLLNEASWSYRLVAGADKGAADPMRVKPGAGSVRLKASRPLLDGAGKPVWEKDGKIVSKSTSASQLFVNTLVRTGTGDIRIASGGDIVFGDDKAAIYSAGRKTNPGSAFTVPAGPTGAVNYAQFSQGGGDVRLAALGDITGEKRSQQLYSNWLFRQGRLNDSGAYDVQPAWWVRFDQFRQGVAALGGGDVVLAAGGQVKNVSASAPTQAYMASAVPDENALVKTGGGDVRVETGGDLLGGQYYADNGELVIRAGGALESGEKVGGKPLYTLLALGDAEARVRANGDANIQAVINPHLVVQASRNAGGAANNNITTNGNIQSASTLWSVFSTYTDRSGLDLQSLNGDIVIHENGGASASIVANVGAYSSTTTSGNLLNFGIFSLNYKPAEVLYLLPANLGVTAFQGDFTMEGGGTLVLAPSATSQLELLASNTINLRTLVVMSDTNPLPGPERPAIRSSLFNQVASANAALSHAAIPVHIGDPVPVRIYAVSGDAVGRNNALSLTLPKAVFVKAGRDVVNLGINAQHASADNSISRIESGRDVKFVDTATTGDRQNTSFIRIGGPGRLEITAGQNLDLGTSAGISSRGNLDNPSLPETGADIHLAAGVGPNGIDYAGAVDRLLSRLNGAAVGDTDLWLARWLTGNAGLQTADAQAAVAIIAAANPDAQREQVRNMLFTGLRATGRDANQAESGFGGDFARGYAALELLFPGIRERNTDGSFKHYQGDINLFASRVKTERGGNIEFIVPAGDVIVGLANTPEKLVGVGAVGNDVLGIVTVGAGDIFGAARGDILVNQSRILTVGGGDVLLWSSEGDIDAGKGTKSASVVPPPVTLIDQDGNVTQVLQGAVNGSGIGALQPVGGTAGDVDLIAPKGTVDAGDAGIRAGNLNIAAAVVLGADNISVSGSSTGTPVADTSAVTAAASGATSGDGGTAAATAALSSNLADAARAAEELKQAFKPTFISAEVIGHGE